MSDPILRPLYAKQDAQDAEEAREERISERAVGIAKGLVLDGDFCGNALVELGWGAQVSVLEAVGRFAAGFEAESDAHDLAIIGCRLWKSVGPHLKAAAKAQAESDARTEIDREGAMHAADAAEAKAA